ncbi:uncharacterized protein CC84DRAFT_1216356 [Paraphaeosphaeria sporulosa]|uniref:Uncharacterized protein n=1 Tax=Paraphaeosphaeria sporulosa TaxID=1460663 RepID=A0A177CKR9_9PLEO|nr:uncharacterized protein CC84DRAFT_1216356 [Paraphaeosphaeria sporulosa]OAG07387.1 hypothetical protein CC84DRAFT_1216356 [Paraphaeosphaeria sporulosa]
MARYDGTAGSALRVVMGLVNSCDDSKVAFDVLREVVDEKKRLADTNLGELLSAALEERERNVKDTLEGAERQIVVRSGEASEGALDFWVRWKGDLEVEIGRVDEERQILDMRLKEMLRASRTG